MVFAGKQYICITMAGFSDLKNFVSRIIQQLDGTREQRAFEVASDLRAQVQNRIITSGENADGNKFPGYSRPYEKIRNAKGRQTDHVDLFFTGRMWSGTGIEVTSRFLFGVTVTIKGKTQDASNKIDWNSARYGGSILEPSQQELSRATQRYGEATLKSIRIQ